MNPSILYLPSIVNDTFVPPFTFLVVALFIMAALTKPCGVDQSASMPSIRLSGAETGCGDPPGPAQAVPPASGRVLGVAGPAPPPGGGAGTGMFQAWSPLTAWIWR